MLRTSPDGKKTFVKVKGLPTVTLKLNRELPPPTSLKGLRINMRTTGVDVDLVYSMPREKPLEGGERVGIDLGVNQRLALSDGTVIEPRNVERKKEEELRAAVGRSRRGSNRRRKRVQALSRECRRNRVKNRNECHRITTSLVRRYAGMALEDLRIRNMTRSAAGTAEEPGKNVAAKSGLNRSILEQSWGLIGNQLTYKAEWAGRELVLVNPQNTSRECSRCGRTRDEPLEEYRTFQCKRCGLEMDRDRNAAVNIRNRAFRPEEQGGNAPAAPPGAGTTTKAVPPGSSCM